MSHIKQFLNEEVSAGAVSANSIAVAANPLFGRSITRLTPFKKKKRTGKFRKYERSKNKPFTYKQLFGFMEEALERNQLKRAKLVFETIKYMSSGILIESEGDDAYTNTDIVARLKGVSKGAVADEKRIGTTFGLEDENGNIIKIVVKSEQAEEFEKALADALDKPEEELLDVAEILHDFKDRFGILDVKWPEVEEDEEKIEPSDASSDDLAIADKGAENDLDMEEPSAEPPMDVNNGEATNLIKQIMDLLQKEAEARKAEADAKKTEAETKAQTTSIKQAMARVKQEEEFLDMETAEKAKKEEEKEIRRLAKLAQWKRSLNGEENLDIADDYYKDKSYNEPEELPNIDNEPSMDDFEKPVDTKKEENEEEKKKEHFNDRMLDQQIGGRLSVRELGDVILRRTK